MLDDQGRQIGILDKNEALKLAQVQGKDLVEIAPNANPPVVKLIDYKKFKYLEAKKERQSKKAAKNVGIKELRLRPFMGEHDINFKLKQGEEFLKEGNQLKISVMFRGREITKKEFGFDIINKVLKSYDTISKLVKEAHFEGRTLVAIIAPISLKKIKNEKETKNQ